MMKKIIKTEGVRGLYRGLPGIWIKDIPGSFLYFGSYELAKSTIRHFKQSQHLGKFLLKYVLSYFPGDSSVDEAKHWAKRNAKQIQI